ncbi:methyltransferase [Streptomyces daliensis]|uniref:Methyltransferase n=1 Tax=Streptomyces daliensis TaxID=299421 RepID=A0A8T4IV57_9ACTN|nr:methyltransferase [Streptomyces daliensis]
MNALPIADTFASREPAELPSLHEASQPTLTNDRLALLLMGHAAFQYLHVSCELGLFELLVRRPALDRAEIKRELGLADRAMDILLLGTTSLGLLTKRDERYTVTPLITEIVENGQWKHFTDVVAFEHEIVSEGQRDLLGSLRSNTNEGIRRIPGEGNSLYRRLAENPRLQEVFYRYMRSWSELAHEHLAKINLGGARTLLDCGGGDAVNALALAAMHPELQVTILEIPEAAPYAAAAVAESPHSDRVSVHECDMFTADWPTGADCVLFAHQLVIWTLEENVTLLSKAYDALADGGQLVILNSMSHDEGDGPLFAALDSAYFASMPAEGGMIYSWAQHEQCLRAAGFTEMRRVSGDGWTPHGVIVATKRQRQAGPRP